MARDPNRSDIETVPVGPDFPGLNLTAEDGTTSGARVALNTRRERHSLRGLPLPSTAAAMDVKDTVRGVACHTKADASPVVLAAGGFVLRSSDGMDQTARSESDRPLFWDGSPVNLTGTGFVSFAQNGPRTYFIETGLGTTPWVTTNGVLVPPEIVPTGDIPAGVFTIGVSAIGGPDGIG